MHTRARCATHKQPLHNARYVRTLDARLTRAFQPLRHRKTFNDNDDDDDDHEDVNGEQVTSRSSRNARNNRILGAPTAAGNEVKVADTVTREKGPNASRSARVRAPEYHRRLRAERRVRAVLDASVPCENRCRPGKRDINRETREKRTVQRKRER